MKTSYFFLIGVFLLGPYSVGSQAEEAVEHLGSGEINWQDGMITTTGVGVAPPTLPAIPAKAMAKRAAISVGLRNLLETLKGVAIDSESTVDNYILKDDIIRAKVSGIIKGAKVLQTKVEPDGSVEVQMGLSLRGELSDTLIPPSFGKFSKASYSAEPDRTLTYPPASPPSQSPFSQRDLPIGGMPSTQESAPSQSLPDLPEPPSQPPPPQAPFMPEDTFTGLIVDGTGLGLHPALVPRLLDEDGNEIYASQVVKRQIAVAEGIVGYSKDLVAASRHNRVTNKPLIVKGLQAVGQKKTDIIVSRHDAQKLQQAGHTSSFLQQARVVIVYD